MAEETGVRVRKDGTITFADNGGVNTYVVAYEEGNFSAETPGKIITEFKDRGCHADPPSLRKTEEGSSTIGFSAYFRDVTDAAVEVAPDFIYNAGFVASTWVSTLGAGADVTTFSITYAAAAVDGGAIQTLVFDHCYITGGSFSEGDPSTTTFSFTSAETFPTTT